MKPAIFLDRDGVITVEKGYVCPIEEIELYDGVRECINKIHAKGYYAIVISNQSAVARDIIQEDELIAFHEKLIDETGLDAIYYCPHHVDGIIPKYTKKCNCRKPEIGMIERALEDFDIDLSLSYMVGDRASDIQTGVNAGIKTVLVKTGYGKNTPKFEVVPDYICDNLESFVEIL